MLTQLEELFQNRTGRKKGNLKVVDETSLTAICYISNYIHQLVCVKDILRPEYVQDAVRIKILYDAS